MTRNSCATLTLATLAALGLSATTAHAQTLAYWNFDTQGTPSFSATVGANPSLAVTSGVDSSSASMGFTGFTNNGQDGTPAFAFILPGANTPGTSTASTAALRLASGNDTAQNNGSALFWKASTAGYSSIVVNYDTQQSSSSTFQTQTFEYSTDGGTTFTPVSSITPPTAYATQSFNLSSIPGLHGYSGPEQSNRQRDSDRRRRSRAEQRCRDGDRHRCSGTAGRTPPESRAGLTVS
jgi:hypothetical protein